VNLFAVSQCNILIKNEFWSEKISLNPLEESQLNKNDLPLISIDTS